MPTRQKFPFRLFVLMTTVPAVLVGGGLWYLSSLVPTCTSNIAERLTSPDSQFDLVVYSRDCGAGTRPNTQASLIPAGENLPDDAASFAIVGAMVNLAPRWDGFGNIELTLPTGAEIYRQDDAVAGIAVIYR